MAPRTKKAAKATPDVTQEINAIKTQVSEVTAAVNSVADVVNTLAGTMSSLAKNHPVVPNKHLEAQEQYMGAEGDAKIVSDKDGSPIMLVPDGTNVEDPLFKEKARMLQFNEELIEVDIHAPPDEQMPMRFEIGVSGVPFVFEHNKRFRVARKFVEGLARAKPSTFGNKSVINAEGEQEYQYPVRKGLKYGFSLVNPTQLDTRWIQSIMAQP
jgi:hypothetical protein